jgi:hypothetical protein
MKQVQPVDRSVSALVRRRTPKQRLLLGISSLAVMGAVAAGCGSSPAKPASGGNNTPTTTTPSSTGSTSGGTGGVGF